MDASDYACGMCRHGCLADNCQQCEDDFEKSREVTLAKTTSQRQEAFRSRKIAQDLCEVRGIYLPQAKHAALKEIARGLQKSVDNRIN